MDLFDDGYVLWALTFGVLGVMGMLAWWVLVVSFVTRHLDNARSLNQLLTGLERQIRKYDALPTAQRRTIEPSIIVRIAQIRSQIRRLDENQRKPYVTRLNVLRRMASHAGLEWPQVLPDATRSPLGDARTLTSPVTG
jgi:hypothetical protein